LVGTVRANGDIVSIGETSVWAGVVVLVVWTVINDVVLNVITSCSEQLLLLLGEAGITWRLLVAVTLIVKVVGASVDAVAGLADVEDSKGEMRDSDSVELDLGAVLVMVLVAVADIVANSVTVDISFEMVSGLIGVFETGVDILEIATGVDERDGVAAVVSGLTGVSETVVDVATGAETEEGSAAIELVDVVHGELVASVLLLRVSVGKMARRPRVVAQQPAPNSL
jgi:hypothetical protein